MQSIQRATASLDVDQIIVLKDGVVAEQGTPLVLKEKPAAWSERIALRAFAIVVKVC